MLHVREEKSVGRARMMRVVDEQIGFSDTVGELNDFDVAVGFAADAFVAILAKMSGLPCSSWTMCSLRASFSVRENQAPSLKILQFCRISMNAEPLCAAACFNVSLRWL